MVARTTFWMKCIYCRFNDCQVVNPKTDTCTDYSFQISTVAWIYKNNIIFIMSQLES